MFFFRVSLRGRTCHGYCQYSMLGKDILGVKRVQIGLFALISPEMHSRFCACDVANIFHPLLLYMGRLKAKLDPR